MSGEHEIDWSALAPRAPAVPEALAARLERPLRDGSLAPGAKLPPERELAAQLGVSRASVREAIHELALKGLVARKPGIGTVVLPPSVPVNDLLGQFDATTRSMREVADFLLGFEPHVAELAAMRASPSNLQELRELCTVDAGALTPAASVARGKRFHVVLAQATHNALLVALVEATTAWVNDLYLEAQRLAGRRRLAWAQHEQILAAVERRDGKLARQLMVEHLTTFSDEPPRRQRRSRSA